jgi:tetratricopeptide (TPR) repeat protein
MADLASLWDFDDPAGSEARLRAAATSAVGPERLVLLTQVARCLGLQEQYDDAHAVLDEIDDADPEVSVRTVLERGRVLNSSGEPERARPCFEEAAASARSAGLEALEIDALHMLAIVSPPTDALRLNQEALALARSATEPAARDWDASLLTNIGMCRADAGDLDAALTAFEEALSARQRIGDRGRTRVARWMIAWVHRLQGRVDEALAEQRALKEELEALGESDPYVDDELALLEGLPRAESAT